jgi:hypothetical protein
LIQQLLSLAKRGSAAWFAQRRGFQAVVTAMRALLIAAALLALPRVAAADPKPTAPLRIAVECQGWGRTKACPAFLLGFVEASPLFLSSPRSDAQVVLYYNASEVANLDRVHLRFVGDIDGAPPVVELDGDLDTRADDDTQRGQLEPGFIRGTALYVAALHPEAVQIAFAAPEAAAIATPSTSPWGFETSLAGFGSWTHGYKSANVYGGVTLSRIEKTSSLDLSVTGNYGLSRQPPLMLDDGTQISLDTDQYQLAIGTKDSMNLSDHWAVGVESTAWHEDPQGQTKLGLSTAAAVEWDRYQADDPRGNRLAVAYAVGWDVAKYNARNELRQRFASYATHTLVANASVRKDKISYGLSLVVTGEVIHPGIRHTVSASPFVEVQLGAHVDVSLSLSVTERAIPSTEVDPSNYEQVIRASYTEPLSAYGSLSLRFHWDRTNGERNDRFNN